jgi:hypothetical protein
MGEDRNRFPQSRCRWPRPGSPQSPKASGRTQQVRFCYAANRRMRHAIDWWGFAAAREEAWSKIVYQTARSRGQGEYGALRGLGACWVRGLVALLDRPQLLRPDPSSPAGAARPPVRAPLPNGGARSRGQGWPQATRQGSALTAARTPPHFGMSEPASANHSGVDSGSLRRTPFQAC